MRATQKNAADYLRESLAYDAITADRALTPRERLFIVESLKFGGNDPWLATVYLESGCLAEARALYTRLKHWRKVGEIAWASGDEAEAFEFFQRPKDLAKHAGASRSGPDHDHILRLLFLWRKWNEFFDAFRSAKIFNAFEKTIVIGGVAGSGKPWLRRLAIAASNAGISSANFEWTKLVTKAFRTNEIEWAQLLQWASTLDDAAKKKEVWQVLPARLSMPAVTLDAAVAAGSTPRARALLRWIKNISKSIEEVRLEMNAWLANGDRQALDSAVSALTGSDLYSMTKTVFFELTMRTGRLDGPAGRVMEAYQAHNHLLRIAFGHFLYLRILEQRGVSDDEILTSVYQAMADPTAVQLRQDDRLSIRRLKTCEEWAIYKLREWRVGLGASLCAQAEKEVRLKSNNASDVRRLPAWSKFSQGAVAWLDKEWSEKIGKSQWVSENQLFELLKLRFKPFNVVQHDQPSWLGLQHLDVHIPNLKLAVEYMGLQHYEAVEIFGGDDGLERTIERDKRKAILCKQVGVDLIYVRYDEDVASAVNAIVKAYRPPFQ